MKNNPTQFKIRNFIPKEKLDQFSRQYDAKIDEWNLPAFTKKKWVPVSLIIILIVLILMSFGTFETTVSGIPTYAASVDDFVVSVTESGEIRAKNSVAISAPRIRRGNLKIIYLIPEGTYVKPGDVVARFDPTEAQTKLKESESELEISLSKKDKLMANHKSAMAQMESQLKSAELSFELSKLNLEQMKFEAEAKQQEALLNHKKNELSYEQTKQEHASKKIIQQSELNEMDIEINQKRNELERAKRDFELMTLTTSAEGLVVYSENWGNDGRKFGVGDQPWPGATIMNLPDLSSMESVTNVNEVDVSKISKEQTVLVKLDAFQDSTFEGKVSSVASLGRKKDNNSNIKVFEILVAVEGTSDILRPGMTTSNKIIIDKVPDVISVPHEAVFDKFGKTLVYVMSGSSYEEREVEIGTKGEDFVVVQNGLEEGEIVALRDPTKASTENQNISTESVELPNS
jgi:HlyD family secretion protein